MKYIILFVAFLRIGAFGFGGGMAMLPLIYQSVNEFGFMTKEEFSDLLALSQVTPGPIAVNAATYVGFGFAGLAGAAAATVGVMLPAFVLMLIVARMLERFKDNRLVQGAFLGIRPVTVGLIGSAVIFVSDGVLTKGSLVLEKVTTTGVEYFDFIAIGIMAATILMMLALKMKPLPVMILMAAAGACLGGAGLI